MRRFYLQTLTLEKVGLVEEEGRIKEMVVDRPEQKAETGNIYLGKITNIEKSLQAAFISYGGEKMGFLLKKELPQSRLHPDKPIERLVTEGQTIIVQVTKEAYQQKGAVLTANITLPGTHMVYLPYGGYVAVSKKLTYEKREDLKKVFTALLEDEEGVIARTSLASGSLDEAETELKRLRNMWLEVENSAQKKPVPSLLWEDRLMPDRLLQKYGTSEADTIVCDDSGMAAMLRQMYPAQVVWKKDWEADSSFSIRQMADQIRNPYVSLPGGAELVIEQTEAMAVIDVNSKSHVRKTTKNETAVQVNKGAIPEIVNQIRLRNLSGMIVIDFINMKKEADRKQIIKEMKLELKKDVVRTEIFGFTALGLFELTRKREYPPVTSLLTGEQTRNSLEISDHTKAYQLERELISRLNHDSEAILLEIHPAIHQILKKILPISRLFEMKKQKVYIRITDEVDGFSFRMEGTLQLVEEYIQSKTSWQVDNLF